MLPAGIAGVYLQGQSLPQIHSSISLGPLVICSNYPYYIILTRIGVPLGVSRLLLSAVMRDSVQFSLCLLGKLFAGILSLDPVPGDHSPSNMWDTSF